MNVRLRGNPAPLVARLRLIAADVDAGLSVAEAWPLDGWIRRRQMDNVMMTGAQAGVTALVLFLSALGIFSLLSVSVSRRTREIGLRAALGANPGHVLAQILSRAALLMGSGVVVGGTLVLIQIARWGEDVALFAVWVALTAAVMLVAGVLACVAPARRALRINATEALREA
jgi:ABC-type antimicrobial peptide transport system permease subunit